MGRYELLNEEVAEVPSHEVIVTFLLILNNLLWLYQYRSAW